MLHDCENVRMLTKKMFIKEATETVSRLQREHQELGIAFTLSSILMVAGLAEDLFDKYTTEVQA